MLDFDVLDSFDTFAEKDADGTEWCFLNIIGKTNQVVCVLAVEYFLENHAKEFMKKELGHTIYLSRFKEVLRYLGRCIA